MIKKKNKKAKKAVRYYYKIIVNIVFREIILWLSVNSIAFTNRKEIILIRGDKRFDF